MRAIVTRVLASCAAGAISTSAMAALLNTGFESPDFALGNINNQPAANPAFNDQWHVSGASSNQTFASANVSTANPNSGQQAVRMTPFKDMTGTLTGFFSPIISPANIPDHTPTASKFDVAINGVVPGPDSTGSEYHVILGDPNHGHIAGEMILSYTGDILVNDGGSTVDTGTDWTTGPYQSFEIDVSGAAGNIVYKRNGVAFYTGALIPAGVPNGSDTVDQLQFLSDNFGDAEFETADFDNASLSILTVPEPGALGLLAGAAILIRRRRA